MPRHILYGDGIHDDQPAIQEMIDSGLSEVSLPAPENFYLIKRAITIRSGVKLRLPRFARIHLADGSNCFMLQSEAVSKPAKRMPDSFSDAHKALWYFVDELSPEPDDACHDFEIEGGIWDFNNMNQRENPIYTRRFESDRYLGHTMFFYNVCSFRISNMTFKDPSNYAIMIDRGSYFTIENIVFDFNFGNPIASNMDGVHLNGNCFHGVIRNLQGACYDDLVALNAHEGSSGDISNIQIDGIFAENCHSAVRLLNVKHRLEHITISNVFGTYYQYCIGFTKYYPGQREGVFDAITLRDIHAAKSKRLPQQEAHMGDKSYHFPLIWLQSDTYVKNLTIDGLHRREYENPIGTICIDKGAIAENLKLNRITVENFTDGECTVVKNDGTIKGYCSDCILAEEICGEGEIIAM